jgi:nucleolar protein 14
MHLESSKAGFTLTHGGRSINELKGDDFVAQGLGDEDEDLEDDFGINRTVEGEEGAVERDLTRRNNFGGFGDDAGDDDVCWRFPEVALSL